MTRLEARDWSTFLAAFGVLHHAGVQVQATGGNTATVPDDTDWSLVQQLAGIPGVAVYTTRAEPAARTRARKTLRE